MKDEGTNLFIMTNVFKQIVSFEELVILAPFEGVCFGHAHSKACQYAISNEKVSLGLQLEHQICTMFYSSLYNMAKNNPE
jgi:hypothetical protein